ncbi:transposase [Microcoleus sp. ARI1-B5]|uniref:transposase n=1 Tax=unclassified Microcoleus TaxID=2642155 RepID=UPI002FD53667
MSAVGQVYNISIADINEHQGFTQIGKSGRKRGLRMVLKTSGLIPQWCIDLGASKLLDNSSMSACEAWAKTKRVSGKRTAKFCSIREQKLTREFDPTAYNKGGWMVETTKHSDKPEFIGPNFCIVTDRATELTYQKSRWFARFVVEAECQPSESDRLSAIGPGIRTFITGFEGNEFWELDSGDFNKIARLCVRIDRLKSRHYRAKGSNFKRVRYKLRKAMAVLRTRIQDLHSECHKQIASQLAQTYDVRVLPTFETSQMVVKKSRKLRSKMARAMMNWAFDRLSPTLEHLCYRYGSKWVRIRDEYTSKTCTSCGQVHLKLGGSKKFKWPRGGYEIPRDYKVAVGILGKAMRDTAGIVHALLDRVVLSI